MLGVKEQVWVTSAVCDQDVEKALVLCYSLRRAYTTRKVAVIASSKISMNLRQALNHGFDFVFYLEEDQNTAQLKLEDFAKLYTLLALRSFGNCVYVSPSMLALKNCDDIFAEETSGLVLMEDDKDAALFLFKPSCEHFMALATGLGNCNKNGSGMGTYLRKWAQNQFNNPRSLHGKYNITLTHGKALVGQEHEISMVNLKEYPKTCHIDDLRSTGVLGKMIGLHWFKIREDDVLPLIQRVDETIPTVQTNDMLPFSRYHHKEPIAIVGMSCRYPGSNNLDEFWELLFKEQDGICTPPPFRWTREQCNRNVIDARKTNAGFLKVPVDEFDSKFFGISPKEVLFMDPQHRLLHEVIWESLEDACIDPHALRGTSGSVFMGSWTNDYRDILVHCGNAEFYRVYMGNSIGAATARLSFLLGLTGPSIATESGCSSAMVAVHMACRSLQLGESNLALAGGVNLLLYPFDKEVMPMVVSPDGHCKTFSEDANGFARAEGCGVLVLKRLSDALKDGDKIWALIRGTAVAQEGVSNSMGTPTVHCESLAMKEALRDAGVGPEQVSYVEAHGTGTVVGDPMEVAAIAKAYGSPLRKEPLIIGSVKTNVGHTESCSGITGIMKVVLGMLHEAIPAHKNLTKLNSAIDLEAVPAVIPMECMEWKRCLGKHRLAGVSSFGITGTDAHVIIEEPPAEQCIEKVLAVGAEIERPLHMFKVSAKTEEALDILISKYKDSLATSNDALADIAYSANMGRANFVHRAVFIARTKDDVITRIQQQKYLKQESNTDALGKVCFLFTGQGSQFLGMAKRLHESSPVFKMHFDYCENIMTTCYGISLKHVLWSDIQDSQEINRTIYSQTSIFCVEYALFKLWESWGVTPDYVLGHSLGEFAAAVCADILSVEDAIKLVAERSRLIDKLPHGKMLVVRADHAEVEKQMKLFAGNDGNKLLDYAAINCSQQTVLAGDGDVITEFSKFCTGNNIKCTMLATTHAFHSKHMDPMLHEYRNVAKTVKNCKKPKCEYISGMKGDVVTAEQVDAEYWVQHTRDKVRFLEASKKAVELGCQIFVEIGPQPVLSALTMMNNDTTLLCLPSLKRNEEEWETILTAASKLYLNGVDIDWLGYDQFYNRKKVRLPHYPFIGKKFWPDFKQVTGSVIHPLVGSVIPNASSIKIFQNGLNLRTHEYIKDHAIGQTVLFPGAGFLEMSLAAGLAAVEGSVESLGKASRPMKVENLMIKAPLALEESKTSQIQTVINFNTTGDNQNDWNDVTVKIFHRMDTDSSTKWLQHATSTYSPLPTAEELVVTFDIDYFYETLSKAPDTEEVSQAYQKLASVGLKFGPTFRSLEKIWRNEEKATFLAKVKLPQEDHGQSSQYIVHPVILDAMIQAIVMLKLPSKAKAKLCVPINIGKFLWLSNGSDESHDRYVYVFERTENNLSTNNSTAVLLDSIGTVLAVMSEVEIIETTVRAVEAVIEQQTSKMPDMWQESWRPKLGPSQHRHDLSVCAKEKFHDEAFQKDMSEKYNQCTPEQEEILKNLDRLAYYNFLRCLYQCGWEPTLNAVFTEDELQKQLEIRPEFSKMIRYILGVFKEEGFLKNVEPSTWEIAAVPPSLDFAENQLSSPKYSSDLVKKLNSTLLFQKLGENYSEIIKGKQSALPILFPDDKTSWPPMAEFYREYGKFSKLEYMGTDVRIQHLKYCKDHCSGDRNIFRILEIGAGTGSSSKFFMENMESLGIEFEYTYTDISPAFFVAAEKLLEPYLKHILFKKLNIEEDPIVQGFTPNFYDWIVAGDVIHATRNLSETLENVRMLMKPGGTFDLVEQTKVCTSLTFLVGLLDGFWRFEDTNLRSNHCTLPEDKWIETLKDSGFEDFSVFPCLDNYHSFISSRKMNQVSEKQLKINSKLQSWIIFHYDESPTSKYLVKQIPSVANRKVIVVGQGKTFVNFDKWRFEMDPKSEENHNQLIKCIESYEETNIEGIVYCWSLDKTRTSQDEVLQPFFHMIKSVLGIKQKIPPRIVTLVNGVVPLEGNDLSHFHTSTIWGFAKSLRNEHPELSCRSVDIGGKEDAIGLEQVFHELWNTGKETQVAYHDTTRLIFKLEPLKPALSDLKLPSGSDRFQLVLPDTKSITDLQFGPLEPFCLEDAEIEIQVKIFSLNFRDVLVVLKPSEEFSKFNTLGFDFAGIVKRVGPQVTKWSAGDQVFGVNLNGTPLPSHIKLKEDDVLAVPEGMTLCDACTLPAVVGTSSHCLFNVAKITAQDTVLIHTASGGVGLSAIEICKSVGATIIATAGSKRKQNFLKSLGIEHVFHSRTTSFGDDILRVTNGRGVSVVLNSLTSEGFKEATLKACAEGARFVEMSKLNIWQPADVKKLRPDIDYTIVDLSASDTSWRKLITTVRELAEKDVIHPIPYVRFDAVHVREALQYMQKAKHVGKILCVMPEVRQQNGNSEVHTPIFNENSTYLITGGLGGIGFVVCKWMVEKGAKHIILAGRSVPNDAMQKTIKSLNSECLAKVQAVQLDVGNFEECRQLINVKIPVEMGLPPLRGVMHAAGTLCDGLVENQTWGKLSSTFTTKVEGTLNLHELTKNLNLEHFVLFSSFAALIGSPGQSNHSAGNNFEDTFAQYRNSVGLPATSVNWGLWGEVGIATEVELPGIKPLSSLQGITGLEYALKSQRTQTGVMNIESFVLLSKLYPQISHILDERVWKSNGNATGSGGFHLKSDEFWQQYDCLQEIEDKTELVREKLRFILRKILNLDDTDVIEDNTNFQDMGMDSLMFVEIKNAIQTLFGDRVTVNANSIRDCNTVCLLATALVKIIEGGESEDEKIPTLEQVTELIKQDCQLPENIMSRPGQQKVNINDISKVLLTGCTGNLGPYLLKELTNIPQITQVVCLMRPNKNSSAEERLMKTLQERELISHVDMDKVCCVQGNVAMSHLGMEPPAWEELCNSVDAVFHCAASVQHVGHYRNCQSGNDTRSVNVVGTTNILEFASTGNKLKQVYCASSLLAVATVDEDGHFSENWPAVNDYDGLTTVAYPITKFVCDVLMKQAIVDRGIPGKVFRFPLIVGDSTSGRCRLEQNHLMLRYLFILKEGVMPSNPIPLSVLPVDICAWASVQIFFNPDAQNDVYNMCSGLPNLDQDFVAVAKKLGFHVDIVEFSEFTEKIRESAGSSSPYAIFKEVYRNDDELLSLYNTAPVAKEWVLTGCSDKEFAISKKIPHILPEFFLDEVGSNMDHLYRDLVFAKNQGWFEKYGVV